jgi:hypothetical protein
LRSDELVFVVRHPEYDQVEITIRTRSHVCEPGPDPFG